MADHTLTITTNFNNQSTGSSSSSSGGSSNYGIAGNMTQQLQTAFSNLAQIMRQLQTNFMQSVTQFAGLAATNLTVATGTKLVASRIQTLNLQLRALSQALYTVGRESLKTRWDSDTIKEKYTTPYSKTSALALEQLKRSGELEKHFNSLLKASSHIANIGVEPLKEAADETSTSFKTLAVNMNNANVATKKITQDPNSGINHLIKWGIVSRVAGLTTQFGQAALKASGGDERSMAIMGAFGTIGSYAAAGGAALGIPGAVAGSIVGLTKSLIDISEATKKVTESLRKFDEGLRASRLDTRVSAFALQTERLSLLANDEQALDPSTFARRLRNKIGDGSLFNLIEQGEDKVLELQNLRNAYKTIQRNFMLRGFTEEAFMNTEKGRKLREIEIQIEEQEKLNAANKGRLSMWGGLTGAAVGFTQANLTKAQTDLQTLIQQLNVNQSLNSAETLGLGLQTAIDPLNETMSKLIQNAYEQVRVQKDMLSELKELKKITNRPAKWNF